MRRSTLYLLLVLASMLIPSIAARAQLSSYTFGATTGSANAVAITMIGAGVDEGTSGIYSIGWTEGVQFNGFSYPYVSVNSNGVLALHQTTAESSVSGTLSANDLATSVPHPIITPFWDDLVTSGSGVRATATGTAPNRVLTIEWQASRVGGSTVTPDYTFQVRMYEATGRIEFYYGSMSTATTTNATIGAAASSTNFLSVTPGTTPSISLTTSNNTINLATTGITTGTMYTAVPRSVSLYSFTEGTGTPTDMSGASTALGSFADEVNSGTITLPFTFNFNGIDYTTFNVADNGFMKLGNLGSTGFTWNNNLATTDYNVYAVIAPFWEDMYTQANGSVTYKTTGTAPNRVFTVQWNATVYGFSSTIYYTYQARLYETTNKLDFIYVNMPTTQSISGSIGFAAAPGNFLSVTASPTASTSSSTANNSNNPASTATPLPANRLFTFTPCTPFITTQPTGVTVCQGASATLRVTSTGTGLTYQWRKDGVNVPGATAATFTIPATVAGDAGNYDVVVTSSCSPSATSTAVALVVNTPPVVTQPPISQAICLGRPVTFNVTATGTSLTYQWRKNGTNIGGATSASYTIPSVALADAGSYDVVISGICGTPATSAAGTLVINTPPAITTQPVPQTLCAGQPLNLSVTATGSSLTYQWRKNGTPIPGANAATYSIANTVAGDAGTYDVVVSGICSTASFQTFVTSNSTSVVINGALNLVSSSPSLTVCQNSPATFSVTATGTAVMYQWRKNGVNIPGANSASYTIASAQGSDDAVYDAVVTSSTCPLILYSTPARLTVHILPAFTQQPVNTQVCRNTPLVLSARAVGTNLTYQWRKSGVNIPGATAPDYVIDKAQAVDAGTYDVVISGICPPNRTSTAISVVVNVEPIITTWSGSQTVRRGNPVQFSVTATGTSLQYQWYKDGKTITGATGSTYSINSAQPTDAGQYYVVISNMCSVPSESSGAMYLFIDEPAAIVTQPQGSTICQGGAVTLSVTATGTALQFQWRKNGTNIPGANSSTYTIPAAAVSDAGQYDVVINGNGGPLTSSPAVVTVNATTAITTQPQATSTLCAGEAMNLTVAAAGTGLTYQWMKDGTPISGATTATYAIPTVAASDAATYTVVVTGSCGSPVTSSNAAVTVDEPASITQHPTSTTVRKDSSVTLSVTATGTNVTYQWRKDTQPISGATTASYTITAAALSDGGSYDVVVTAACGSPATSNAATLTVTDPIGAVTGIDESRAAGASLVVMPNPAHGQTVLAVTLPSIARVDRSARLILFDAFGNEALDLSRSFIDGDHRTVSFDATGLASGTYYCRFTSTSWSGTIGSLVVQK